MRVKAPAVKRCTEDDERDGCGRRRDLSDGLQHGRRNRQLHEAAERTRNRPEYHRIHQNTAQDRKKIKASAAKGLKDEYAKYVVERHDHCDHHRWNCNRPIAENIADERDAHENVVAAKNRLDHGTAPRVVLLDPTDNARKDKRCQEDAPRTEEHKQGLESRPRIGDVDVVEHHKEEEHAEHHAVHVQQLFFREQARPFDEHTDCHQTEQGHDATKRDKKVAKHKKASPPIPLYYNRKAEERQRRKSRQLCRQIRCIFLIIIVRYTGKER